MIRNTRFSLAAIMLPMMMAAGCNHQDQQAQQVARPVKVFRVASDTSGKTIPFAGEVRPRLETTLSFRVPGKIIDRPVEVGDRVRKGQHLARLDASDYRLATQALEAQLKSAQAERDFAGDDLNRYRELLKQRVISPPEFDRRQTAYSTARERVAALAAQLEQAANQLAYTDLIADQDGAVTALEVETGQVVSAGQAVVKLARLDEKEIRFDVPEQGVGEIKLHQPVDVSLWSSGDRRFRADIREIAAIADPSSRTYRVKATLREGLDQALLGMTATVWIPSNAVHKIAVPLSAVFTPQDKPGQAQVWLVDEQTGSVSAMPIQTGEALDGERIAVTGVTAGQLLVSAGVQRLVEGQSVRFAATANGDSEGSPQ